MKLTQLPKNTKVMLGLSGGVDSSVSALLLKQAGIQVEAVFMKNWEDDWENNNNNNNNSNASPNCSSHQDLKDAQAVCDHLQIPLHTVNFAKQYWDKVFSYFLETYSAGLTPNPDILCNKEIKFKAFLDYAINMGADYIATGHYAKIKKTDNNKYLLLKGYDQNKDQSYFLHQLNQYQLSKSLFPIGDMPKDKVREIAKKANIPTYKKKDSTGICFIGERKFKNFLENFLPAQPGKIITPNGDIIGDHDGLMYYTIGQRQGLNIGGLKNYSEKPWYVADKNIKDNLLIAVQESNHEILNKISLQAKDIHWIQDPPKEFPYKCKAKIRYRQSDQECEINYANKIFNIKFTKPQRAITPGQSIVFYQNDISLGGGVISR